MQSLPTQLALPPVPSESGLVAWAAGLQRALSRSWASLVFVVNGHVDQVLRASATFDPANLADGAGETTTVTVTGAVLGDFAEASFSLDLQGIIMTPSVSAADTVSVRFQNETTGAINLGSGTLRVRVKRITPDE